MRRQTLHSSPTKHPGHVLKNEFLRVSGTSVDELAAATLLPISQLELLIAGQIPMSEYMAFRLADHFGTSASYWMRLQNSWDTRHRLSA